MRDFCRRSFVLLCCAFGVLVGLCAEAAAGTRLALVLGNGKYQAVGELANPANDAADIAGALRGVGFEVIEARDATREGMARAIRDFTDRLRGADVALFFYAGHGLQMNGENYLLPVDVKIDRAADVRFNAINLSDIQQEMEEGSSGRANIIILDACRNNPFLEKLVQGGRSAMSRGLGRVETSAQGSLIVYSTQPNNIALDGAGRNSPFTSALLSHIATPGLEARQMISRVRRDVLQATGQKQTPWDSSSLIGDVYLAGQPAAAPSTLQISPAPAASPPQTAPPPLQPTQVAPSTVPRIAPAPAAASTAAVECEALAAPAPPFASPAQLKEDGTRNWSRALPSCQNAVQDNPNDPRLQYLLGRSFNGLRSYTEAARYYAIAAEANYAPAQSSLGTYYARGLGVIRDSRRAFDLFTRAAATGNGDAMGNLGSMYVNGDFVKRDGAQALAWFEKAIEAGNSFALGNAGVIYFNGTGVPRDYEAAAQYFQQAADMNNGFALKFLAVMYERGLLGKADPARAAELRLQAARVDPDSQTPVVSLPKKVAPRQRNHRTVVIRRYRFLGCIWLWC